MPSSTSSSEASQRGERREAPQHGLRLTASDRPGVAQPVPERDIPARPWPAIAAGALAATLVLTGLWEVRMRQLHLVVGDLHFSHSHWAEQRRRIDTEDIPVVVVGDSRMEFGTDLARFEQLTGVRPLQLAMAGAGALPFLEDLASEPKFHGLVVLGLAEPSYFRGEGGPNATAVKRANWESPSDQISWQIRKRVDSVVAFTEPEYSLSKLAFRADPGLRQGVRGPQQEVWKVGEEVEGRQTYIWRRLEVAGPLRDRMRRVWSAWVVGPGVTPRTPIVIARSRAAVDKITARGGEVIFVRPPSAPELRITEDKRWPRAKAFDALVTATRTKGIHIDDLPTAQGLDLPEFSHLSRGCATVFTDAFTRRLTELTPRVKLLADAPRPLTTADCVKTEQAEAAGARPPS